jgi:hypothetical protein
VREKLMKFKGGRVKKDHLSALLNAPYTLPYHLRAGRYQRFGTGALKAAR